jgi:hypothetical protein
MWHIRMILILLAKQAKCIITISENRMTYITETQTNVSRV